ncbi:hypothetical protein GS4_23_00100 [Gordonia soli NBRC 108243]|uniref:Uncharacterized protein n=1 Tax=Gordonia soli NBRC 108243 TaxID=1223545 RepID=M0QLN6_9ACTN|nr:hypothetical protein GS4_23_00100 [Gordonia soli NBRC 108243]
MLVIVFALVGLVQTLILTVLPFVADLPRSTVEAAFISGVNVVGYVSIALIAAQSLLQRRLLRIVALSMIGVTVATVALVLVWSDSGTNGTTVLVAMSTLMAVFVLVYSLVRGRG